MDEAALEQALDTIAETIVSCSFAIAEPDATADPEAVNFYLDDEVVPLNEGCLTGEGWQWVDDDQNFQKHHVRLGGQCTKLHSWTG